MAKRKNWMDDGDDAHFVSAKKVNTKKHLVGAGSKSNGRPDVVYPKDASTKKSRNGKTTRKRVAGK